MSDAMQNAVQDQDLSAAIAQQQISRASFVIDTYKWLSIAIVSFAVLSFVLSSLGVGVAMVNFMAGSKYMWLAYLGGFMVVGWLAANMADTIESRAGQVAGLGLYVVAEALMFAPLFAIAAKVAPGSIWAAALVTLTLVVALTVTAYTSKRDFSFLGSFLKVGGIVALGVIVASIVFGFTLGIVFSGAMVLFAGGCVLYDTNNILRHYPTDRPVGAALHLFASIALMLWYVLRFIMDLARD
jgi:hypothetical protein